MTITEYALKFDDGTIGQPSSLAFCRLAVQTQGSPKAQWKPRAVAVLRRSVGEWEELPESSER